jgi:Tripartite tricarboxylate transporter TctB family
MKKFLSGHILFSLGVAVVFLILIITDLDYNYQARMVPMIVAVPSFILAVAQFLIEVKNAWRRKETVPAKINTEKEIALSAIAANDAPIADTQSPAVMPESALAFAAAELASSPTVTRTATGKIIPNLESNLIAAAAVEPERANEPKPSASAEWKKELVAIGWLLGLVVLVALFGFNVGLPVFVFTFLKWHGHESWRFSILYTVIFWALVYVLFVVVMKGILYPGMVFDRLGL